MPKTYSPLRYPGGKTKLYHLVQPIVEENLRGPEKIYIEPFAGGSGLALKLLFSGDVTHIVLNDFDQKVYSFWDACLNNAEEICEKISVCEISIENWRTQREVYLCPSLHTKAEIAFATFFLNRCNISGVIRGGPIGGIEQTGNYLLDARFNREDLIAKILRIHSAKKDIEISNLDASIFLQYNIQKFSIENTLLNIDPPYVKKGHLLYENSFDESDHAELSNIIHVLRHKWIVTYDECQVVYQMYADDYKEQITLSYSAGQTKTGHELIIYGNNVILNRSKCEMKI